MREISVLVNYTHPACLSYEDAWTAADEGCPIIFTNCLDLFDTHAVINLGYKVTAWRVQDGKYQYLHLNEMLAGGKHGFCFREIRGTHNTAKMLRSGAFTWRDTNVAARNHRALFHLYYAERHIRQTI